MPVPGPTSENPANQKSSVIQRALLLVSLCLLPAAAWGQGAAAPEPAKQRLRGLLTDDEDGRLDVSELLFSRSRAGFLPVPIVITEPALGYGGGLAAVWFHQPPTLNGGQLVPPSVSVAAGFLTSDGSRGGFGGHSHSWKDDTWRFKGFGGRTSLELESTGVSPQLDTGQALQYSLDARLLLLEGSHRIAPHTWLGLRYVYADTEVGFKGERPPGDLPGSGTTRIGGLGLLLGFDSRDNVMSPTKGHRFELRPAWFGAAFGGDAEYARVDSLYTGYWNRGPLGFGVRLDANWIQDGAPFYAKPFIFLRGVPVVAFLGQEVLSAEPEIDWNLSSRWTLLAFAGAGRATNDSPAGKVDRDVYAGGAGFRYLLARVLGLRAGVDLAWSSGGNRAFYIVVGSVWSR